MMRVLLKIPCLDPSRDATGLLGCIALSLPLCYDEWWQARRRQSLLDVCPKTLSTAVVGRLMKLMEEVAPEEQKRAPTAPQRCR